MKILHVTPHYEPAFEMGGIVRSLSQLCRGLVKLGVYLTVFTTNNNRLGSEFDIPVNQEVDVGGVKVWYFHTKFFNRKFYYSPELGKACYERMQEFDLLHLTSFWCHAGIPAGKAARKYNKPYIMSTRGTLTPYCLTQGWLKKKVYMSLFDRKNLQGASAIHYTTELEREETHQKNKLSNTSFIVPNPVSINEVTSLPDRDEAKRYFFLPQDANVISYVGRLHKRKALNVLIEAFSKILQKFNNSYLIIAGPDDGDEVRLRQLVALRGLNAKVKFLGYVDAFKRSFVLRASDLFWLATYPGENFGNAAVEAMAAEVPVLVSENVGICDAVREDNAGLVVSVDEDAITMALIEMISNSNKLKEMGKNAYQSARNRYDIKVVAKLMATAYEDVLTDRRSSECNWSH